MEVFTASLVALLLLVSVSRAQDGCNKAVSSKCTSKYAPSEPDIEASVCLNVQCGNATKNSDAFKKRAVNGHNEYRLRPFTNGSFGGDMLQLTWDDQLANAAWGWANELCSTDRFEHDHGECRTTAHFDTVGQNLAGMWGYYETDELQAIDYAMEMWYNEINKTSADKMFPLKWVWEAGHYTQMVWSRTYRIGCAFVKKTDGSKIWVACNYGPAGNVLGPNVNVFLPSSAPATNCVEGSAKGSSGLCEVTNEDVLRKILNVNDVQ